MKRGHRSGIVGLTLLVGACVAGCGDDSNGGSGGSGGFAGTGGAGGTGGTGGAGGTGGIATQTVSVGGVAWGFTLPGSPYDRIAGATISVLEMPELATTSNNQGEFVIDGLAVGSEATFVLEHPDYPLTYTGTQIIPEDGIDDLTFQIPNNGLYSLIELGLEIESDPSRCQMVSTFTRFGKTIGDPGAHGEAGAVLTIEPSELAYQEGPIYFNDDVLPDRSRTYSSIDGGVLILNAEPGDYTLHASCVSDPVERAAFLAEYPPEDYPDGGLACQTQDVQFEDVLMKCRAGVFVNASPSYGLQALP